MSTCNYLIVLLETESPTVVVIEDFEERFGKHPVLWSNFYIFSSFILIFDFENLHQLIWHLERYNLPFWTRGNLLWGWALPEIVHGTDPTPQAPPPSPSRILPPGFLQLRFSPPRGFSFEISSPSFGLFSPSSFSETLKSLVALDRKINTGWFFNWPSLVQYQNKTRPTSQPEAHLDERFRWRVTSWHFLNFGLEVKKSPCTW